MTGLGLKSGVTAHYARIGAHNKTQIKSIPAKYSWEFAESHWAIQ